jgi:peptide/nickel transport system ATP-binding protein
MLKVSAIPAVDRLRSSKSGESQDAGSPDGRAAARVRDLEVTFPGGVRALRGVSLTVAPGEILGVVGESGSGKSVLGLTMLGLLGDDAALAGESWLGDTEMVAANPDERRAARRRYAGAVFQDPNTSLNPTAKVGHQVVEAADPDADAATMLRRAGIPEPETRVNQYPYELSGGLRQRAMIAMAIARSPSLIVLDEPTTALDLLLQAEILRLFSSLREELQASMLFITHDLVVASLIADRVAVLYGGRVAELGDARQVLRRPSHPYTAALLTSRLSLHTPLEGELPTLPGEPPDPRMHAPGCPFAPRCGYAKPRCGAGLPELEPSPSHSGEDACFRAAEIAEQLEMAVPDADEPEAKAPVATNGVSARPTSARVVADGAEPAEPHAIEVIGVSKAFGKGSKRRLAVDGVSLTVPDGASLALVGASGCGKTTMLRMIVGLEQPDDGKIKIGPGGRPQLVFQDAGASLTPWLTVGDHLAERLTVAGVPSAQRAERIRETLSMVGLPADVAASRPGRLSGGQRQRVALARAVVECPPLLACDEPTSALDVSLAATVINLLRRLRGELGLSILFVTHDLAVARAIADDVAVMQDGKIIEQGSAEDVLHHPKHEYTRKLVAAVPDMGVAEWHGSPEGELRDGVR